MKILPDECLPRVLKKYFADYDVRTVSEMKWAGIKNGALLRLADANFDAFVTADQNVEYQQNLTGRKVAIVVLAARDTRLQTLAPLIPQTLEILRTMGAGELVHVTSSYS